MALSMNDPVGICKDTCNSDPSISVQIPAPYVERTDALRSTV